MKASLRTVSLLLLLSASEAFLAPSSPIRTSKGLVEVPQVRGGSQLPAMLVPEAVTSFLSSNLQSGPLGVVALLSVASSVCVPITQVKNLYGISVGYGASVAAMGLALRTVFAPTSSGLGDLLTQATVFYGVRLAGYLLLRDFTSWKKLGEGREQPARLKRVPFALSLATFYAFMTTPVMYALRHCDGAANWKTYVSWAGTGLAWAGALLEMTADSQKYIVKQRAGEEGKDIFQGPSDGVYALTRHPNYTGEVLFWAGTWLAGVPFFGRSVVAWLCSTTGLYGIVSIMRKATKGLEERQEEKYKGQGDYESWKSRVKGPLVPFISNI